MASLPDFITDATRDERERLENALLRGEQLRWATRPIPTAATKNTGALFAFALPWLGITAFATWAVLGAPKALDELQLPADKEKWFTLAFLSVFWAVGLLLVSSPWLQKRSMRRTIYAITDRRALVMAADEVKPYRLHEDLLCERKRRAGGRGDLIFTTGRIREAGEEPEGFINVPDVVLAEEKLDEAIQQAELAG